MTLLTHKSEVSGGTLHCDGDESAADTELTVTTPIRGAGFLSEVTVQYSVAVTLDVVITKKSHHGAAWDTVIETIEMVGARSAALGAESREKPLVPGDQIEVVAPAGGSGVTSAVTVSMVTQ